MTYDLTESPVDRWTPKRKAELLEAIHGGEITAKRAREIHGISKDELTSWRRRFIRYGMDGLRLRMLQELPR